MQFLSDVYLRCPDCDGTRYRAELREVKVERLGREMSIADVLELTIAEAVRYFADDREVVRARCSRWPMWAWTTSSWASRAHAQRRRGATPEAGRLSGRSGQVGVIEQAEAGQEGHAVPV